MRTTHSDFGKRIRAYSFVELMVVLVLIALLFAAAVPSYRQYLLRTHRIEAHLMLLRASGLQEEYFFQHGRYATSADELYVGLQDASHPVRNAHYVLGVEIPSDCSRSARAYCYVLVARAVGTQRLDVGCQMWRMDESGLVHVYDSDGRVSGHC